GAWSRRQFAQCLLCSLRCTGWGDKRSRLRCSQSTHCVLEETLPAWGLVLMRLWTAGYLQFWAQRRQKVLSLCLLPLFIYHAPRRPPRSGVSPLPRAVPHSRVVPHCV